MFLLLSRFLLGGLFICLHKEQNEVSKITKGGRSEGAAYLICRRLQAARLASLDLLWSWKLEVLATPSSLRSLSQNFSEAAEAPPHRYPWTKITRKQVLARERHGAFSTHNSSCVVKVNGFQTVIETLSPCWHNPYSIAKKVMYFGIIVEDQKAFITTFVYSIVYTTVNKLATQPPHTPYAP